MSTVRTCTTPEDGWSLYSHFLGNLLLVIRTHKEIMDEVKDKAEKDKCGRVISKAWAELVGNLYMIMRRMKAGGYDVDVVKMQKIIDMVVESDLTDPKVHDAIYDKQKELNVKKGEFEAELARLKAEYAK